MQSIHAELCQPFLGTECIQIYTNLLHQVFFGGIEKYYKNHCNFFIRSKKDCSFTLPLKTIFILFDNICFISKFLQYS